MMAICSKSWTREHRQSDSHAIPGFLNTIRGISSAATRVFLAITAIACAFVAPAFSGDTGDSRTNADLADFVTVQGAEEVVSTAHDGPKSGSTPKRISQFFQTGMIIEPPQEGETENGASPSDVTTPVEPNDFLVIPDDLPTWYADADLLVWWIKGNRVPALVSTSPTGTARANAGVLGTPGASVLFGNGRIDDNHRFGGRFRIGRWLSDTSAVELGYFGLGDGANNGNYFNTSTGNPILARPFFNADPGVNGEDSQLVAFPNVLDGSVRVTTKSEMHSANVLYRHVLREGSRGRLSFLSGYRYLRFRESLQVREDLTVTEVGGLIAQGTTIVVTDQFLTENDFHGGDLGFDLTMWGDGWEFDATAKLGIGGIHRQLDINGSTVTTAPGGGGTSTATGGLLALSSNIGHYSQNELAFLPELNLNFKYQVTDSASIVAGYTLLYLTDAFRTGDQIDRVVNGTLIPGGGAPSGPTRPLAPGGDTSLWAQGVNIGVTIER